MESHPSYSTYQLNRYRRQTVTNPANIHAVQAKELKNGKYEFTAILKDGSQEIIKKSGALKPFVNVYETYVNGNGKVNSQRTGKELSAYCTYNNKPGVKQGWRTKISPIKSIEVELI